MVARCVGLGRVAFAALAAALACSGRAVELPMPVGAPDDVSSGTTANLPDSAGGESPPVSQPQDAPECDPYSCACGLAEVTPGDGISGCVGVTFCNSDAECPPTIDGRGQPTCRHGDQVSGGRTGTCVLPCMGAESCPGGMTCTSNRCMFVTVVGDPSIPDVPELDDVACTSPCLEAYQSCARGRCSPAYIDTIETVPIYNITDVASLPDGSFAVVGYLDGSTGFDPWPVIDLPAPRGGRDVGITVFDAAGNLAWSRLLGADEYAFPGKIAAGSDGSVVVSFFFHGTIGVTPAGPGLDDPILPTHPGVIKLQADGSVAWIKTLSLSAAESSGLGRAAAVGPDGSVYLGGSFRGAIDLDPGPSQHIVAGGDAGFIVALSAAGDFVWGADFSDCLRSEVVELAADARGTLWVLGSTSTACDIDPGPATVPARDYGFQVQLAAADGRFMAGAGVPYGNGDIVFGSDGAIYVAGGITPGASRLITKLDAAGAVQWTQLSDLAGAFIAPSPRGGVVAAGTQGAAFELEFAITEIDAAGNTRWTFPIRSTYANSMGIAANADRFVVVGAHSDTTIDFDPGAATQLPVYHPGGFITRYAFEAQ